MVTANNASSVRVLSGFDFGPLEFAMPSVASCFVPAHELSGGTRSPLFAGPKHLRLHTRFHTQATSSN